MASLRVHAGERTLWSGRVTAKSMVVRTQNAMIVAICSCCMIAKTPGSSVVATGPDDVGGVTEHEDQIDSHDRKPSNW